MTRVPGEELLQQLKRMADDMVELLSRRTGPHLHDTLGDLAEEARTARRMLGGADRDGYRQVQGTSHERDLLTVGASRGGRWARVVDSPDLSGVPSLRDLMRVSVGEADNKTLTNVLKGLEQRYGPYRLSDVSGKYVIPRGATKSAAVSRIDMMAKVIDSNGERVGKVYRVFQLDNEGRIVVHNMALKLKKEARGKGFSTAFTAAIEGYYRRSGVDRIELMATDKDGGLAWARAGYTWNRDPQLLAESVENITDRIAKFKAHASPADQQRLDSLLSRFAGPSVHYPEPGEIAMLRGENGSKLGEKLMRGSSWWGMKML